MTPEEIRQTVKKWVKILRLKHWDIDLVFDSVPDNPDAYAAIHTHYQYEVATVKFNPESFAEWDALKAERIVVHELLHIHFKRLGLASDASIAEVEQTSQRHILEDRYEFEEEGLIDRLAYILVGLG